MQKTTKHFSDQLNKSLDDLGLPQNSRERANALSKMLDIPKQQAWSLLEGHVLPDQDLLQRITSELDVEAEWLLGKK